MSIDLNYPPNLARYILSCFTGDPDGHPGVLEDLTRYMWNNLNFREALLFEAGAAQKILSGDAEQFVYDKRTQVVLFNVSGGTHQLLIAHLAALHKTDFSKDTSDWYRDHFVRPFNATSKLVDYYIGAGLGLFESSVGPRQRIWASPDIEFNALERKVFRAYEKFDPNT